MTAAIEVAGQAATLTVVPTDPTGSPIAATSEVAYESGGRWTTIYTGTGKLERKVAAGRYRVTVRLGGRILESETVVLRPGESHELRLPVKTLAFVNFAAVPLRRSGRIACYELHYDLDNRLEELSDISVRLLISRESSFMFPTRPGSAMVTTRLTQ